jgi:hypothetical protein
MLKELDNYDWAEVFGEGSGGNCTAIIPQPAPGHSGSIATFSREDVVKILGQSEGEREERDWVVYGKLKDGRYFLLLAVAAIILDGIAKHQIAAM